MANKRLVSILLFSPGFFLSRALNIFLVLTTKFSFLCFFILVVLQKLSLRLFYRPLFLVIEPPGNPFLHVPKQGLPSSSRNFAPIMKYKNESNRSQTKKSLRYIVEEPLGLNTRFRTMPLNFIACPLRLYEDGLLKSVDISASLPASLTHLLETTSGMSDPESRRNKPGMIVRPL